MKRLMAWEFFIGFITLALFWGITYMKGYEMAAVTVTGLGILVLCIAYPRGAFYVTIILVYAESLFGAFNMVATVSKNFNIVGYEPVVESAFFYIIFPGIIITVILGYIISRFVSNRKPFGMLTTEYIMLVPPLLVFTFVPMSIALDHPILPMIADCLPGLFFILGIISARVFFPIKGLFFLMLNALCIGNHAIGFGFLIYTSVTGLMGENPLFMVWSGRILMGPTDFNIFLTPICLAVILYCKKDVSKGWMTFYNFSFWAFFLRLVISLYRGPIAAMFLAFIVLYFLASPEMRPLMRRFFIRMFISIVIFVILFITIFPLGGMMLNAIFVERFTGIFKTGEKHEASKLSLAYRVQETEVAWREITEYPIFGHGPGAELEFRTQVRRSAEKRAYVHNGYLWLWHKFGILGPISMILFLVSPFIRGLQLRRKKLSNVETCFLHGIMATTVCIFPAIITNSIIARPQGLIMLVFCFMVLLTIERRIFRDEGIDIDHYL